MRLVHSSAISALGSATGGSCRRVVAPLLAAMAVVAAGPVCGQTGTQRGATLGGITGAIAGGLIGDHNDEAGAGAAIGGALGAVAGGLLGNAADRDAELARQRYYHQQQQLQQQYWSRQQTVTQGAVSVSDVVSMSRSGLGDPVIINQIRQRGVTHRPQVSDIITMHQQGVRETVITAMQQAPLAGETVAPAAPVASPPAASPPVIIEREVPYPVPVYHGPRFYHHSRPRCLPPSYYEFRFGF